MSLVDQIAAARKKVITDGYEMSVGEIINLYKEGDLKIDPVFQRLFRWRDDRKTRFIESLILGIPIPPIFVSMDEAGVWELVDGLQRISTILQFTTDLTGERAAELGPLVLNGTRFLPALDGKRWEDSSQDAGDGIDKALQREIKRTRLRVEILKAESDTSAKFELFQRLNTGGAGLTEQEVRNSIAVSLNRPFYDWLMGCARNAAFMNSTSQTANALESEAGTELALRFFAFRNVPYQNGLDVHEYLDDALMQMTVEEPLDMASEGSVFERTFTILDEALSDQSFKRWNGHRFGGKFLMSVFEVLSTGVSHNLAALEAMSDTDRTTTIVTKAQSLWSDKRFTTNSGGGVRGTTRLAKLLPIAEEIVRP